MKASRKLQSLGDLNHSEPGQDELLLELGRSMYKLHFQLLLLVETSHKMAAALGLAARTSAVSS